MFIVAIKVQEGSKTTMEFYTVAEVKDILRLKKREKVYALCNSNQFPCFKLGRDWLIDKKEFDKWLKGQMGVAYF